ncbi:methylmalonyl-CoA mutase [Chloroflexota bacterium]
MLSKPIKNKGMSEWKKEFTTDSGLPVKSSYSPIDLEQQAFDYDRDSGDPGEYPYTRGIKQGGYRNALWAMTEYGGFGSPSETNKWFKYLMEQGATGLAVALDLPTQIGYDSDHPVARGEVGKVGVPIDSLRDMEIIFDGVPFETLKYFSTTGNAISPIYLAWVLALAEKRKLSLGSYIFNIQNDILKEYISRGTYIYPPKYGMKFTIDTVEYVVKQKITNMSPLRFCGYHLREAGANAIQEVAFTLANAIAYLEEIQQRGISVDSLAGGKLRLLLAAGMDIFEEAAKYRAVRRMWAKIMKERFGAQDPTSMTIIIQSFTQGSNSTAQQPMNNIIRGVVQAIAAILGGQSSLHVTSYDEALALPTEQSVTLALRTQQILANETGIINTVDPLGGSYFVETLTNEIEKEANKYIDEIDALGSAVEAIEKGYFQREIAKSAYERQKQIENNDRTIVGVNKYQIDKPLNIEVRKVNPEVENNQITKLKALRRERDNEEVKRSLAELKQVAKNNHNTVPPILRAVKAYATVGEISDTLRQLWGEFRDIY